MIREGELECGTRADRDSGCSGSWQFDSAELCRKGVLRGKHRASGRIGRGAVRTGEATGSRSDPTAHLYEAIRLQTRIARSRRCMRSANPSSCNDNRAVYRSGFKLDEDLAVRAQVKAGSIATSASRNLAMLKGWQSVNSDPGDFSGHRLLGGYLLQLASARVARVNELFTSQLLQPLKPHSGSASVGEAEPVHSRYLPARRTLPSMSSIRYLSAMTGDSTCVGNGRRNDTWGDDVAFAALQDPLVDQPRSIPFRDRRVPSE